MLRTKKTVSDSLLKKACEDNKNDTMSKVNKDKAFATIDELIDNIPQSRETTDMERKQVFVKKNKRKGFIQTIAVVACAAICALGISGGVVDYFGSITKSTATDPKATSLGDDKNNSMDKPENISENNAANPTEKAVEYYKENDVKNVKEGKVVLSGGTKATNYTNPTKAVLKNAEIKKGTCKWTIKDYKTNKTLYKGSGTIIQTELAKLIEAKADGQYIIAYTYYDKAGNQFTIYEGFAISTTLNTANTNDPINTNQQLN